MERAELVQKWAQATVFGGVVAGMVAKDSAASEPIVKALWPLELDLSGYEVAAECVLIMAGAFGITVEQLDAVASILFQEADNEPTDIADIASVINNHSSTAASTDRSTTTEGSGEQ